MCFDLRHALCSEQKRVLCSEQRYAFCLEQRHVTCSLFRTESRSVAHHVLKKMNDSQLLQIAKSMKYCLCPEGEMIIKQGDSGSLFFILGTVSFAQLTNLQRKVTSKFWSMEIRSKSSVLAPRSETYPCSTTSLDPPRSNAYQIATGGSSTGRFSLRTFDRSSYSSQMKSGPP